MQTHVLQTHGVGWFEGVCRLFLSEYPGILCAWGGLDYNLIALSSGWKVPCAGAVRYAGMNAILHLRFRSSCHDHGIPQAVGVAAMGRTNGAERG